MRIETKQTMVKMLARGAFGNSLRVWNTPEEVLASDYRGLIAIRSRIPGAKMQTHILQTELTKKTEEYCCSRNCSPSNVYYSEMSPPEDNQRLFSGHVMHDYGYHLEYSLENDHLGTLMEKPHSQATGIRAKLLLEHFLDPDDLDDLYALLENYPDSVIEFTVSEYKVGWANRRMLIWEVRNY